MAGIEARSGRFLGEVRLRAAVSPYLQSRLTIRTREGGFRGVASIGLLQDRSTDAARLRELPGKGVFHEFHTAAVWPVRLGSAPAGLRAGGPREPAGALLGGSGLSSRLGYPPSLLVTNPITHQRELFNGSELVNPNNPNSPGLNNEGKVVSGTDRAGDKWVITVHGPGKVIVTDTTPNDGVLDDDINTIQLVGTSLTHDLCHRQCDRVETTANFNGAMTPPAAPSCSTSSSPSRA